MLQVKNSLQKETIISSISYMIPEKSHIKMRKYETWDLSVHYPKGSLAEKVYGSLNVSERHRHRFEFNPCISEEMEKAGFIVSATSPDGSLAGVELRDHPYMIATQAHPELISRPTNPHPLFMRLSKRC